MTMLQRVFIAMTLICLSAPAVLAGQPPSAAAQEGFVSIDQLPPSEQLPAAPLLIAAYAFVWVALIFYVWTVWRRLDKVEADMRALERRSSPGNLSR
jgi:CcmD family protein